MTDRVTGLPGTGAAKIVAGVFARLLLTLPVCWLVYVLGFHQVEAADDAVGERRVLAREQAGAEKRSTNTLFILTKYLHLGVVSN